MTDVETVAHALYVAKGAQNIFGPWDSNLYPGIKGPFMRQAQGLLGPIIARERAAALAAATPLIEARVRAEVAAKLPQIMQDEWGEICSDTGCHPEDIYRASPRDRKTWYTAGHWTRAIAAAIRKGRP